MAIAPYSSILITIYIILILTLQCKSQNSVCTQPIAITNSDIKFCPQALALGSVNYTCSRIGATLDWSSTVWSDLITVTTSGSTGTPSSNVDGVTFTETNSFDAEPFCLQSTLTFTGNLTQLNGETLTCGIGELSTTRTIAIPSAVAPGLPTELNHSVPITYSSSSVASCDLYTVTVQWSSPNNTGGQGVVIEHYLVSVSGPDEYTCPPDQCNVTTTNTTLNGLLCNTSYIVSVRAVNCAGASNDSESVEVELPPTIVTTPTATSQCTESAPVISSDDACQVFSRGSLSYTCTFTGPSISWSSSAWFESINVDTMGTQVPLPPLQVTGVTISASFNDTAAGCLNSTLTFTGNLMVLNGVKLLCSFGELTDKDTIVIPGVPGPPTLSVYDTLSGSGPEPIVCDIITLQWTPPTNTGGQGVMIEYYLVSVSGPDGYTCPPDQCNVTTTNTTLTKLQCDTHYTTTVRAVNCAGTSNHSKPVEIFTPQRHCSVTMPTIIANSSSLDVCQVLLQSSLNYTCINNNPLLRWNISSSMVEIIMSDDAEMSPQAIISEGVILTERHFVNAASSCFTSIVTITGNLTALTSVNGTTLLCGDSDEVYDMSTIIIPSLALPGSSTLTNIALSTTCGSEGSQVTVQWTPPTNTDSGQITQYELTVVAEGDCSASDQLLCNQNIVTSSAITSTTITGLQCDTNFMVSVRAINCAGQKGTPSQTLMFSTATKVAGLLWWHTTLIVCGVLFLIVIMFMIVFIGCRNEQSKKF